MAMLEKIHSPEDIKGFDGEELESLCEEMRRVIIDTCLLYTSDAADE